MARQQIKTSQKNANLYIYFKAEEWSVRANKCTVEVGLYKELDVTREDIKNRKQGLFCHQQSKQTPWKCLAQTAAEAGDYF